MACSKLWTSARAVVVAVYIVPSAARSRKVARGEKHPASLPAPTSALLERILDRAAEKTVVLAMGNPYLADDFPAIQNYICTFSNVTVSEISARPGHSLGNPDARSNAGQSFQRRLKDTQRLEFGTSRKLKTSRPPQCWPLNSNLSDRTPRDGFMRNSIPDESEVSVA